MYLKKLICQGFKSFADRTEFEFLPGVTGIVGPNGCGKSNVVDAVKWVLGDQSARSLRGRQMMDVVFNGSGTRKPSGMAQVDLVFDNADRRLPSEAEEVTVTRRLYRSGESEYLINGQAVRLRDVRELFMDTGVGIGAYSIIEQGRVDVLLQANPQERRLIFEEAAGISRYKARKREAQRKLDRVEQNLLRIEDIVEEVEKRLRSVKNQAGRARTWRQYDEQLRARRSTYALAEYHRLSGRTAALESQIAGLTDESTRLRTEISSAEARDSRLQSDLLKLDEQIRELDHQMLAVTSDITACRERAEQSRQRVAELGTVRDRALARLAGERHRSAGVRRQIELEEQAAASLEAEYQAAHAVVESLAGEDRSLSAESAALRGRSEEEKAGVIDSMRRVAQAHNQIQSLQHRREQLEAEQARLCSREAEVVAELGELARSRGGLEERAAGLAADIRRCEDDLSVLREQAALLDGQRAALNHELASAKEYRSGLLSRRQLLAELDRNLEGVDAGVRELLHLREREAPGGAFGYVQGLVADLLAADVASAALIETALGEFDQYVVVDDSRAFFADAARLADFPGRVRAICLDLLPPFIAGPDLSGQEGFVSVASSMVRCPPQAERLVRHLLGRTIVVRTLEDARRMLATHPPMFRFVTLSGELLEPDGRCQLGPAGSGTGLISRKSELREIDQQLAEIDERISAMQDRIERSTAEIEAVERRQEEVRAVLAGARTREVENHAAIQSNAAAAARLEHERPLIAGEIRAVRMQMEENDRRSGEAADALAEIEREGAAREQRVRELDAAIEALAVRRAALAEQLTEAKVAVARLGQRRGTHAERLRTLRDALRAGEDALREAAREAEDAAARITQAERVILAAEARLAELCGRQEELDAEVRAGRHRREHIHLDRERLAAGLKTLRGSLEESESRLHALQMEQHELRVRIEELVSRTQAELGIDLVAAHADYRHEEQDWDAVQAEIEDLRERIRRLGNVNLDAIAEQEELENRASFLTGQRDDLRHSRRQLEELIEQLNQECRERFTTTFEAVRGHFQELFRRLFGGGKADILLEQPPEGRAMDVLEAGIEIHARPPGKELQSISLMSGGEKTMTAIALLLAIFRSRPSPFAILDEVDAALDEANNERFNRIIGDFLEHSQFLIITHSKRTMTIADVLYGVTMQEAGVSKRVSVRFAGADVEAAAVA